MFKKVEKIITGMALAGGVLAILLFAPSTLATQATGADATTLKPGEPIRRDLKGGDAHTYQINLETGQFLRAVFMQRGVDIIVKVFGPDGQKIAEVDSPNGAQGPEPVSVIAKSAGVYRFEVRSLEATAAGKYEAKIEELLSATQYDARVAGERATLNAATAWLAKNAVPLRTVEAGNGFADMQPLKKMVGNARLVSLGEATHGTREFFQLKHRMLEFLVTEMGFTIFGIEATMPEGFDVNEYVLTGKGDAAQALAGLYFWTWDTEEVLAMIEWMRQYNADPRHTKKVKFYGFDMQSAPRAAKVTLAYLRKVDAEQATVAEKAFAMLANPLTEQDYTNQPKEKKDAAATTIDAVLKAFDARKADYIKKTNEKDWAIARQHARVLAQNIEMRKDAGPTPNAFNVRDRSMAENIRWILEHEGAGAKMVAWAHNGHVATENRSGIEWMGNHLRKWFGADMVVFGFSFNQGGFQAMEMPIPTGRGLRPFTVRPAPEGSLDHTLAAAGLQIAAIDLRTLPKDGEVAKWFAEPQQTRSIGAGFGEQFEANFLAKQVTPQLFDALLFVEKTTAARPNYKAPAVAAAPQKLAAPANLDFEEGEPGKPPLSWLAPVVATRYGYEFGASSERPHSGKRSALLSRAPGYQYGERVGSFTQRLDATAYRGKRIRLRVMARAEHRSVDDRAYVRLFVAKTGGGAAFDSKSDYPITSKDWRAYEIEADVPDNADAISYGVYLAGNGRVWLDTVAVEVIAK